MKLVTTSLAALAHEGRLSVFRMLVQAGEAGLAAGVIAREFGVPPNSLSTNLTILSHAGLITSRRAGRSVIYRAEYGVMAALLGFLVEDCCQGSMAVCSPLSDILAQVKCCAA